jgi:tetrahydromethanopterin S-methyltransferase subunit E
MDEISYGYVCRNFVDVKYPQGYLTTYFWGAGANLSISAFDTTVTTTDNQHRNNIDVDYYAEKLKIVLALMELGYDVLYTDITTVILRDPLPFILQDRLPTFLYAVEAPCLK